jgi:tetratricopeptide (TPR) repeat protein/ferredoxin
VSLSVLPTEQQNTLFGKGKIKRSRVAKWRAATLIAVHVLIAIHIVLWQVMGLTVSPVEPSESIETLAAGVVNAGFVFFTLAILSTLILGRWFCGWACHVVAFQDLCTWIMNKMGIRPRPFRSRLLVFVPLVLAFYMFIWPVVHREVLPALFADEHGRMPVLLGDVDDLPGITTGFLVEDFWATFGPWYMAAPFLLVCTFGAVYFLGSKGFCTYGCPYGGFFGPADYAAPVRIVVNDNCNGCGHCTAVCGSNVRVHEEVRDFGMVVDPGCMKHLDCVSVCPNNALSVGFARPSIFAPAKPHKRLKPEEARAERARAKANRQARYDLSWPEEFVCAVLFLLYTFAFRDMLDHVPLLMAIGMAGIAVFCTWKLWSIVRKRDVRLQSLQLKKQGRVTLAGWTLVIGTVLMMGTATWSGHALFRPAFAELTTPVQMVLRPEYSPSASERDSAWRGIAHLARADGIGTSTTLPDGDVVRGTGWRLPPDYEIHLAYLFATVGKFDKAESHLRSVVKHGRPTDSLIVQLTQIIARRAADEQLALVLAAPEGAPPDQAALQALQDRVRTEMETVQREALAQHDTLHGMRVNLGHARIVAGARQAAQLEQQGTPAEAKAAYDAGIAEAKAMWDVEPESARFDPAWGLAGAGFFANQPITDAARATAMLEQALTKHKVTQGTKIQAAGLLVGMGANSPGTSSDVAKSRASELINLAKASSERWINGAPGSTLVGAARVLLDLGRRDDALPLAERAIAKDAGRTYGASTAASAAELMLAMSMPTGDKPDGDAALRARATETLENAKRDFAGRPWDLAQIARGMINAGAALGDQRLIDSGAASLKEAAEFFAKDTGSESPMLRIELGTAMLDIGRIDEGVRELVRAAELSPENPFIAGLLGQVYGQLQNPGEMQRWRDETKKRFEAAKPKP